MRITSSNPSFTSPGQAPASASISVKGPTPCVAASSSKLIACQKSPGNGALLGHVSTLDFFVFTATPLCDRTYFILLGPGQQLVSLRLPVALGVPQAQDFHDTGLGVNTINNKLGRSRNHPFPGPTHVPYSTDMGIVGQRLAGLPHSLSHGLSGGEVLLSDVVLRLDEICKSGMRPSKLQTFTPHFAKAAFNSSSVANAPRSAAATPTSTALRNRASSITSSHVALSGS